MEALTAMQTRNSVSRLSGTVRPEDLKEMLSAGIRAPDHGMLQAMADFSYSGRISKEVREPLR